MMDLCIREKIGWLRFERAVATSTDANGIKWLRKTNNSELCFTGTRKILTFSLRLI